MAEGVLFNIAEEIIMTLGSLTAQEVALWEETTSSEPEVIVGRVGDKVVVKTFLMNSNYEHNVSVISIVGIGGLGKTTLAQHVYNDEQVQVDFGVKLWVSVSGSLDVRKIIKGAVGSDSDDQLESLKKKLEEKIEKKKYLLVLDDVWDGEDGKDDGAKWDRLKELLPRDAVGSKIVVTTRSHLIAKFTSTIEPHVLEGLSVDESWDLFRRKAFPQGQESGHVDVSVREEIGKRCCGVPLVIKAIASAQRLRTLLLEGGKWDEGSWESICREFRRLRVLVLSELGMKEVSPLIQKLKHLKYLDLSYNEMEALSNSVTSLVNLQVLKLNYCSNLKELPRDISKLINLRHLDVGCSRSHDLCNLEYMPRGIGKLTSLQTLSCFVVAKKKSPKSEMIGGLDELRMLNELRGRLEIRVKGYEGGSCVSEFEGAKLMDKQDLQSLNVWWDRKLDSDSDIDLYDKMLQSLRPNLNLQEFSVEGYGGMRVPSWVSDLSNLVRIHLQNYGGRLKHIPPLHGIPSLEELTISGSYDLEYIDSEGVGGKEVSTFFPSLKTLDIDGCPRLKGWWKRWSRDEMNDDRDESTIEEGLTMLSFPRLSSLSIDGCPNLTSMPLFPTLDEYLNLNNTSSMPLQQTMKMTSPVSSSSFTRPLSKLKRLNMLFIDDMESLPEVGLQNLSSLQRLLIRGCGRLKSMPLPDQGMQSLQRLDIRDCSELKSLSESESESQGMIPYLPSLQFLRINDCIEVLSGIARGWGKEWPNIKHIPDIVFEYYYIQKEGRFVDGHYQARDECPIYIARDAIGVQSCLELMADKHYAHMLHFPVGYGKAEKVLDVALIVDDGTGWIRCRKWFCVLTGNGSVF
ncbi:hypothetical protein NC653_017932 [Populus alba x Populus x berolinensis]|uniref:NB-ARC domain-containing protein n=1 Tax=Populus alba x Populus x berolinensis TaxID=444605 RepID=A0AAD6QRH7_9ROSI|nr:hypothetical protein NC653_017932 [Populus alba x Populus x berolinensis]